MTTVYTAKDMKRLVRPEFEQNPDNFYPTDFLRSKGFIRCQCVECGHYFWKQPENVSDFCGDSNCVGSYTFIGEGAGIGHNKLENPTKISFSDAWKIYMQAMETFEHKSTAIDRYPVVARWRKDVDYVAAGIYCFQPQCVSGEIQAPENPLICPQFCLRFNDLDSIGISGRHHGGFVMLGNQAFNYNHSHQYHKAGHYYFAEEVVAAHLNWLVNHLHIDINEITLTEDIWAGGGNLGPCVEIFVKGLEVGNMVLMQFRYDGLGGYEPLDVKVVDVGIGLERIPWLINGSLTSYHDTHAEALQYLKEKLGDAFDLDSEELRRFSPFSCMLNVDESDDMEATWKGVAQSCNYEDVDQLKKVIGPFRDAAIICDHTRALMMAIYDGSLPAGSGGAFNLRAMMRRILGIMNKNEWFVGNEVTTIVELMNIHKEALATIGQGYIFETDSLEAIVTKEYDSFMSQQGEIEKELKKWKSKNKTLEMKDWVTLITALGIPVEKIQEVLGQTPPDNLFTFMTEQQERNLAKSAIQVYDMSDKSATRELFMEDERLNECEVQGLFIIKDLEGEVESKKGKKDKKQKKSKESDNSVEDVSTSNFGKYHIVALDQTVLYPTSGGQDHDSGRLCLNDVWYEIIDVTKVGPVIFHHLDREIEGIEFGDREAKIIDFDFKGVVVLDRERRDILKCHHSAAHVLNAAAKKILGPHIWQSGAHKSVDKAHLDITHFETLDEATLEQIEDLANAMVKQGNEVVINNMNKRDAEGKYGFTLYQGGVVAGTVVRVVNIEGLDVEACCGTHVERISEIGLIRILSCSSQGTGGGIRLSFVAGKAAHDLRHKEQRMIKYLGLKYSMGSLMDFDVQIDKFYESFKKWNKIDKYVTLVVKNAVLAGGDIDKYYVKLNEIDSSGYMSAFQKLSSSFVETNRTFLAFGEDYLVGILPYVVPKKPEDNDFLTILEGEISKYFTNKTKPIIMRKKGFSLIQFRELSNTSAFNKVLQTLGFVDIQTM
eukprot:TRINITY_DN3227_c4_g1_i1.p1 TRINITY_DN3227_c4_g1~~TRINITY_DN3227_c4_g1_i1.p1  ORF type:complete len:1010 (-),score=343.58 TRINITY_DN3227_c4_g1_i1:34-3027(-)